MALQSRLCCLGIVAVLVVSMTPAARAGGNGSSESRGTVVLVVGAGGAAQYTDQFDAWQSKWQETATPADWRVVVIEPDGETTQRDRLLNLLEAERAVTDKPLWLVLIGHGTFDGRIANFNLAGPDLSADELRVALIGYARPIIVINTASASGPFLTALSGANRVVITSTHSGQQTNFARFGSYLADAIGDPAADLDKDRQTSLWEAFLAASRQTQAFYEADGRLATEHAALEDNGDRQGVRADWFVGLEPRPEHQHPGQDGTLAHRTFLVRSAQETGVPEELIEQRDLLEEELNALRAAKATVNTSEYAERLETILLQLAETYEQFDRHSRTQQ